MKFRNYQSLLAERNAVASMLERVPPDAVLDRKSIAGRLESLEEELAAVEIAPRRPASARLTFNGRPVVGSHGMFADFGARAIAAFSDTVAVLSASQLGSLADSGPVPNREQNQLLITGTALGSFGFELEEQQPPSSLFDDKTPVAEALEQSVKLLRSVAASDDELTDAIAGLDRRVVRTLRGFLEVLAANEAICTLESDQLNFGFRDVAQVRDAANRLADDNIHEEEQPFFGELIGNLPTSRMFEFKLADGEVIKGRIAAEIIDPNALNKHLHEPVNLKLTATRLGSGRVRYVLHEMPIWPASGP